jgi:hypothetical protein
MMPNASSQLAEHNQKPTRVPSAALLSPAAQWFVRVGVPKYVFVTKLICRRSLVFVPFKSFCHSSWAPMPLHAWLISSLQCAASVQVEFMVQGLG